MEYHPEIEGKVGKRDGEDLVDLVNRNLCAP